MLWTRGSTSYDGRLLGVATRSRADEACDRGIELGEVDTPTAADRDWGWGEAESTVVVIGKVRWGPGMVVLSLVASFVAGKGRGLFEFRWLRSMTVGPATSECATEGVGD